MSDLTKDERSRTYLDAIRRRVCAACLDQADDGSCGLKGRVCTIETHLPGIVEALLPIRSDGMNEYIEAVEAQVCRTCSCQDAQGLCRVRDHGECALYAYLPLVLDAIDEVRGGEAATAAEA